MGMRPGIKKFHAVIHSVTEHISPWASLLYPCVSFLIGKLRTETPHPTYFGKAPADEKFLIIRSTSQTFCQLQYVLAQQDFDTNQ